MTRGSQEEGQKSAEWVSTKDIHTSYFVSCNQPRPKRLDPVPSYTTQSLFKGVDFFLLATPQPKCSLNVSTVSHHGYTGSQTSTGVLVVPTHI